jgi:hypothetical protein
VCVCVSVFTPLSWQLRTHYSFGIQIYQRKLCLATAWIVLRSVHAFQVFALKHQLTFEIVQHVPLVHVPSVEVYQGSKKLATCIWLFRTPQNRFHEASLVPVVKQSKQESIVGPPTLEQLLATAKGRQDVIGSVSVCIASVSEPAASLKVSSAPATKGVSAYMKGIGFDIVAQSPSSS